MPDSSILVAAYAGPGRTRLESRPRPEAGVGEIVLDLLCCGLCGTDLFKFAGDEIDDGTVLGHELVGMVAQIGQGVDGVSLGDRVVVPHHVACGECPFCRRGSETKCPTFKENLMVPGGFSSAIRISRRAVERAVKVIPESLSSDAASFLEPGACVLRGVRRSGILEGSTDGSEPLVAVVIGGGSMGLLHLLVLNAVLPSCRVIVSDPVEARRELSANLGAFASAPPGDGLRAAVLRASDGLGADAAFDTVGGSDVLGEALSLLREGGTAILFAHASPNERAHFELNTLFKGERRVVSTYSGSLDDQNKVFDLLVSKALDPLPLVSHRMPLSRFDDAVMMAKDRTALKIMITPDETSSD